MHKRSGPNLRVQIIPSYTHIIFPILLRPTLIILPQAWDIPYPPITLPLSQCVNPLFATTPILHPQPIREVFTLPHQFLVESSGFLRNPRNPRNEPEFENLRIFIKFSCVIPGSFLVHSHSIPGLLYQHQEWAGIFLRNPSGQTGSFPVIPYYYYIS
jgi:hypothetical protein